MPQLRKDPILSRWVIIATERAKRPEDFKHQPQILSPAEHCVFCRGHEHQTGYAIYSYNDSQGNWLTRVIPSKRQFLSPDSPWWKKGKGPYDFMAGYGYHETIVETPDHIGNLADAPCEHIYAALYTYCDRLKEIEKNQKIKSALIFKNYGSQTSESGVSHSRSQLIAGPVNFKRVKEELEGTKEYFTYHDRCIFCDILRQELIEQKHLILDQDGFVAFVPFAPRFPFEICIAPKTHTSDFYKISDQQKMALAGVLKTVLLKIKVLLNDPSYNYVIHSAPFRRAYPGYWSTIEDDYHWHIEITPSLTRVAGFEWGTGCYICPSLPEDAAKLLRETQV